MSRLVAVIAALALVGNVAACSLVPFLSPSLTADEWAWCQGHWSDGLDASQNAADWYFDHMGMRDAPDTIRVCRAAAAKRQK